MNKEAIIECLKLRKSGNKGWYVAENCPFCGGEKMGVVFGYKSSSFNCFSGKCGEKGHINILLEKIGRLDLVEFDETVPRIEQKELFEEEEKDYILQKKNIPLGFKRVYSDWYLKSRGVKTYQFEKYIFGFAQLEPRLRKNYITLLIMENDVCVGYVSRSRKTKEWIEWFNERRKLEGSKKRHQRYINSTNTDFEKILFGFEEIIENETNTVILVEGITDKFNIENLLGLDDLLEMKCCCTFGKRITKYHIQRLKDKKIKNIILLYDPDALKEVQENSFELEMWFNVQVAHIKSSDSDPGDLTFGELSDIFCNLESPFSYKYSKLFIKNLV